MKIIIVIFVLIIFQSKTSLFPCTVFVAKDGNLVLAGNNEDWSDPNTKFWLIPAGAGKHGWIKFGFAGGYPQGGMNDQGLFWDATACTYLEMHYSEANKEKISGALMQKVMEECSNLEEAVNIFNNYYCADQYGAQYLVADKMGESVIIEGDSIIVMNENFQVMTNFYHSHPELGGYPCWRYETAKSMLENSTKISKYLYGSILSATHQEGKYPTQYSQIYDLKEGIIYLFYYHNYEEFITIALSDELKNENREYKISLLFSKIKIISPVENEIINSSSVNFYWRGLKTSRYEMQYSTDSTLVHYESLPLSIYDSYDNMIPVISFALFGLFLFIGIKRNVRKDLLIISAFIVILMIYSCKDDATAPQESITEFQQTVDNLESNKTYYWKIIAHPEGESSFSSESSIHKFRTGN